LLIPFDPLRGVVGEFRSCIRLSLLALRFPSVLQKLFDLSRHLVAASAVEVALFTVAQDIALIAPVLARFGVYRNALHLYHHLALLWSSQSTAFVQGFGDKFVRAQL